MSDQKRKTILLVEDEIIIALAEAQTIASFGYNVLTAHSGEKAIELVAGNEKPDLILMDIELGSGISGPEAATRIVAQRTLPIVFLTCHSERQIVEQVRGIKHFGYAIKNSGDAVLESTIALAFELFEAHQTIQSKMELLRASEDCLRRAHRVAHVGRWEWDLKTNEFYWEDDNYSIHGIDPQKVHPSYEAFLQVVDPLEHDFVNKAIADALAGKCLLEIDYTVIRPDNGKRCIIHASGDVALDDAGKPFRMIVTVEDITERKGVEDALRRSLGMLARTESLAHIGSWEWDVAADNVTWSDEMFSLFHRDPAGGAPSFAEHHNFFSPVDMTRLNRAVDSAIREGSSYEIELTVTLPDGATRICMARGFAEMGRGGKATRLFGSVQDVTERKHAENQLKQSEENYRLLVENSHDIIYRLKADGVFTFVSRSWTSLLGHPVEKVIGQPFQPFIHPNDLAGCLQYLQHVIETGEGQEGIAYRVRHIDGSWRWHSSSAVPLRDESGTVVSYQGVARDITAQKQTEAIMRARLELGEYGLTHSMDELMTRTLDIAEALTGSTIGFFHFLDKDQQTLTLQTWSTNTLTTMCTAEGKGQHYSVAKAGVWVDCIHQRRPVIHNSYASLQHRKGMPEGHAVVTRELAIPIFRGDVITGIIGIGNKSIDYTEDDVTAVSQLANLSWDIVVGKQAEESVATLLHEKELILKEVHHRIKNNMNTMMSLLSLQSKAMKDPGSVAALNDARQRMQSMMVLYDKLYRSEGFRELSAKEYLVPLVHEIIRNFPNAGMVETDMHIENFTLDARRLSPLGIIVNELITNMMKHAFAGRARGLISIAASLNGHHAKLIVQDNGIGLPEGVDCQTSAKFGLRLVDMLTQQIGGSLRIERLDGTRFILEFEV